MCLPTISSLLAKFAPADKKNYPRFSAKVSSEMKAILQRETFYDFLSQITGGLPRAVLGAWP
jgi:hypothetical protein